MIPFEPQRWEDEQRDYLDKSEEVEAAGWILAGIAIATLIALIHEICTRLPAP